MDYGTSYINNISSGALEQGKINQFKNNSANINSQNNKTDESIKEFEALVISQLYKIMFETVEVDENFGGGMAEETFRGFMVDEYGKIYSESGGIGISEQLQKELITLQQQPTPPAAEKSNPVAQVLEEEVNNEKQVEA